MDTQDVSDAYRALERPMPLVERLRAWDALWAEVAEEEIDLRIAVHGGDAPPDTVARWLAGPGDARAEGEQRLRERVLASDGLEDLPAGYAPFVRRLRTEHRVNRPENGEPSSEIEALGQGWWAARARWQPAASAYAAEPSEAAWRAMGAARSEVAAEVSALWTELARRRAAIAANAGFEDFTAWCWASLGRTWSILDADALCERVLADVVPRRRARVPWDRPPQELAPDDPCGALIARVSALDGPLGASLDRVRLRFDRGLRAGGVSIWRPAARQSVVLVRPTGGIGDMDTLVHEAGHALQWELGRPGAPMRAVDPPLEVAELASLGLECLVDPSARKVRLMLEMVCSAVAAHRFQRWAYANPEATVHERNARWREEERATSPGCSVLDETGTGWLRYPHLALHPYYCLEYALGGLAALGLRQRAAADGPAAVARYLDFLRLPPGTSAPAAYEVAGVPLFPGREDLAALDLPLG